MLHSRTCLVALLALAATAFPTVAQDTGLTQAQVQAKYPRMSPVHIKKCDRNGDGVYTRTEMLCVSSIYQQMYLNN